MRIGYLDCFSGVSGDMFLGALVDAGVPLKAISEPLATLPFSGYEISAEKHTRASLATTKVTITLKKHEHPHRGLDDVISIIEQGNLDPDIVSTARKVFERLANAEARAHDTTPQEVHFHEVGAVDAICDVVGTIVGLAELDLDFLKVSPIALGGGTVEAAHGTLPVPAPATAFLLEGLHTYGGPVDLELTTPTGAALVSTLAGEQGSWPDMKIQTTGCGAGGREIDGHPNMLRLVLGETDSVDVQETDHVWLLEANLDDMTGEEVGFASERLFQAGALDAFTTPIYMKKGRPAVKLSVLCSPGTVSQIEAALWRDTSTFGIRRRLCHRSKLNRSSRTVHTRWGDVSVKAGYLDGRLIRCEPEYEDCRRIAEEQGLPLRRVIDTARKAWSATDTED